MFIYNHTFGCDPTFLSNQMNVETLEIQKIFIKKCNVISLSGDGSWTIIVPRDLHSVLDSEGDLGLVRNPGHVDHGDDGLHHPGGAWPLRPCVGLQVSAPLSVGSLLEIPLDGVRRNRHYEHEAEKDDDDGHVLPQSFPVLRRLVELLPHLAHVRTVDEVLPPVTHVVGGGLVFEILRFIT